MNISEKSDFISKEFPNDVEFFKLEGVNHKIFLPKEKPDIENICEIYISPRIHKVKLVKTDTGLSNEGQYLTGNKLIVEVILDEKLLYAADEINQSIFAVQYETFKSVYVVLPDYINGKKVEELYKSSRLTVMPYILHAGVKMVSKQSVNISALLFLDVKSC